MAATRGLGRVDRLRCRQEPAFLSFLYQTHTILRGRPFQSRPCDQKRQLSQSHRRSHGLQRPRSLPTLDYETQADTLPSFNPNSTLTPLEDIKFRRIFEAAARGLPPPSMQVPDQDVALENYEIGESLDRLFETHGDGRSASDDELDDTARLEEPSSQQLVRAEEAAARRRLKAEKRLATASIPESLRGAWRDVQRSIQQNPEAKALKKKARNSSRKPQNELQKELERLKEEDISRVKSLVEEAKSDREVWAVLNAEVFSRVGALINTIKAQSMHAGTKSRKSKTSKKAASTDVAASASGAPDGSDRRLSPRQVAVVEGTYSTHLVHALQAFRKRFPRSPFATALLPAVKKLDPISQVLGSSTGLYNELLYVAWRIRADIAECAQLTEDLYSHGLASDRFTSAVFIDAQREMRVALAGSPAVSATRHLWWKLQGVKEAMTRWHAAMDLLDARAEEEERIEEQWENEQRQIENEAGEL